VYTSYQYGPGADEDALYANILSSIASRPCYNTLRTQEQLGYIVWSGVNSRPIGSIIDFYIIVQSGVYSADFVRSRIDIFVEDTLQPIIHNLSDEDYDKYLKTLRDQLDQPDTRVSSVTARFWKEISMQRYDFNRKERMLNIIDNGQLSKAKFIEFADKFLGYNGGEPDLLTIKVVSSRWNDHTGDTDAVDESHLMNKPVEIIHASEIANLSQIKNNSSKVTETETNVQGLHSLSQAQPQFAVQDNGVLPEPL
jgi:insulysin